MATHEIWRNEKLQESSLATLPVKTHCIAGQALPVNKICRKLLKSTRKTFKHNPPANRRVWSMKADLVKLILVLEHRPGAGRLPSGLPLPGQIT